MKKSVVFFIFIQLLCINIFAQEYVKVIAHCESDLILGGMSYRSTGEVKILIRAKSIDCINVIFRLDNLFRKVDLNISCSDFNTISTILDKYVQWKKIETETKTTVSKELGSINNVRIITYLEKDINDNPEMSSISTSYYWEKVTFIYNYGDFVIEYPEKKPFTIYSLGEFSNEYKTTSKIKISDYIIIRNVASSLTGDNLTKLKEEIKYYLDQWEKFK